MAGRDTAEQAQLLRIAVLLGPALLIIGAATIVFVGRRFDLPAWILLAALIALGPAVWGAILLVEQGVTRSAMRVITTLHAANQEPQRTGFSRQEALVARGQLAEAAAQYRAHIAAAPDDIEALVALGRLLAGPLGDADGASAAYLAARRLKPGPALERAIGNDLIDLYRRVGDDGRLRVELARFASVNRSTREGRAAAERLRELKADSTGER